MLKSIPADISELLLQLYRLAYSESLSDFQNAALDRLKPVVAFDAAMWGTATTTERGIDVHTLHLHQKSPNMMRDYEEFKHLDSAASSMLGQGQLTRGFSADHWFHRPHERGYRDFLHRYRQPQQILTLNHDPVAQWGHWITLFRENRDAQANDRDVRLLDQLAPHLMQALVINQRVHLDSFHPEKSAHVGVAMADPRGRLYHCDPVFERVMAIEWPDWRGPTLPAAAWHLFLGGQARYRGDRIVMAQQLRHGLVWLHARPVAPADDLAPREALVARLVAQGHTYKEIARILDRAPATVRTQIRVIHQKLGTSNAAQVSEALRRAT